MIEHTHNFLVPTILVLATILLVFGMKYFTQGRQIRLRLANDGTWQRVAEAAAAAHATTAALLTTAQAELADVKARLVSIETMLREVG